MVTGIKTWCADWKFRPVKELTLQLGPQNYAISQITCSIPLSVLLWITDDIIKCSKLHVEQQTLQVVSLHKFGHFMSSSVVNKSKDNGKLYVIFVFATNLNQ